MEYIARNHNTLAPEVYKDLFVKGIPASSRNGPVLRMPGVTTLVATQPRERVNFCSLRDANPFFHLVEAMAMLAPCNSVRLLSYLAKNMSNFSDNGVYYNAFYGERLRVTWGDQLSDVVNELSLRPESRQAVAQIWDPKDLTKETKDKACNTSLVFSINSQNELEMWSTNRSNDAIWGILTGANVVHLSFFQEYVACGLGLAVGPWSHSSANLHVYTNNPQWELVRKADTVDYYKTLSSAPLLFEKPEQRYQFDTQVRLFCTQALSAIINEDAKASDLMALYRSRETLPFIRQVAIPTFMAWHTRKHNGTPLAVRNWVTEIGAADWYLACSLWMSRRNGGAS